MYNYSTPFVCPCMYCIFSNCGAVPPCMRGIYESNYSDFSPETCYRMDDETVPIGESRQLEPSIRPEAIQSMLGPIQVKYLSLGGENSPLGKPTSNITSTPDGKGEFRKFQRGIIINNKDIGTYAIYGQIYDKWNALGGLSSFLRYPLTDETGTPDGNGRFNHFQGGSIYWTPQTGAHEIHGAIRDKWKGLGWEKSFLGYPLTDETATPDGKGRFNHFQGGSIYWTPQTGAHEVHGAIRERWKNLGWERSFFGYPLTDEAPTADGRGRYNKFQRGSIYWFPDTGINIRYKFTMDSFTITNTRSANEDTVYASMAAKVNDQPSKEASTFMGDLNNGTFNPNLSLDFYLPDGKSVALSHVILNKGHSDSAENITKAVSAVAAAIASGAFPAAAPFIQVASTIFNATLGIIFADCDGVVAADKYVFSNLDIFNKLGNRNSYTEKDKFYPGTDSSWGCGSNSKYYVTWTLSVM